MNKKDFHCDSLSFIKEERTSLSDYSFKLHLSDVRYDSLLLRYKIKDKTHTIRGKSSDGSSWSFLIPDSAFSFSLNFKFTPKMVCDAFNDVRTLVFFSRQNEKTYFYGDRFPVDRNIIEIQAKCIETGITKNIRFRIENSEESFIGSLHSAHCEIAFNNDPEFKLRANYPFFLNVSGNRFSLNTNNFAQCLNVIKKYPDSHYLIGSLAENKTNFNKENLQILFNAFSEKQQRSYFGKIIAEHLKNYFIFSNMKLPRYDNGNMEFLVQDSTKINLIVFSASWCAPCHELIPTLKEIYIDLKDRLDITYISMDETATTNSWRAMMKAKDIPWRSLLAEHYIKTVRSFYNPSGAIPFAIMVYPNKTLEVIDIRKNNQMRKLYSACNGNNV